MNFSSRKNTIPTIYNIIPKNGEFFNTLARNSSIFGVYSFSPFPLENRLLSAVENIITGKGRFRNIHRECPEKHSTSPKLEAAPYDDCDPIDQSQAYIRSYLN